MQEWAKQEQQRKRDKVHGLVTLVLFVVLFVGLCVQLSRV